MQYNRGPSQYTELQMFFRICRMVPALLWNRLVHGRYLDVLLTHAAPRGIQDADDPCHRGFKMFLRFMKWFKPVYLIHGHVHLYDLNASRQTKYLETTVVNAYNHVVLDIDTDAFKKEKAPRLRRSL